MKTNKVYLDNNATTPLAEVVKRRITESLEFWPNPSSSYDIGLLAKRKIEVARAEVANAINSVASDIIFTSGGTESNNQVIQTAVEHYNSTRTGLPHIITSEIEHVSILHPLQKLQENRKCEVTFVSVNYENGTVNAERIAEACKRETCLVTIMLANNETGVIQFYGPRIGALYVRGLDAKKTPLCPVFYGGGQERGYRPGTENTPMIVGLGAAAEFVSQNSAKLYEHLRNIRDYLENSLKVLLASGIPEKLAKRTVRFSIGKDTEANDIDRVLAELGAVYILHDTKFA